jgi:uncharacterized cupin superfamily protein
MVFGGEKEVSKFREIRKVRINPDAEPTYVVRWLRGAAAEYPSEMGIFHPEGMMAIEDFLAGETTFWSFWHPEFHLVLKGTCEITYCLAPWYDEEHTITVGPGDAYILPNGANVTFKVSPEGPMRHMCVVMPRQNLYGMLRPKNIIQL